MKWSDDLYGNNDHILMTLPPPEFPADPTKPSEQDPCEDVQESRETRRRGSSSCRFLSPPNSWPFSPPLLVTVTIKVLEEDIAVAEEDIDIVGVEKKEAAEEERRMKAAVAKVELS